MLKRCSASLQGPVRQALLSQPTAHAVASKQQQTQQAWAASITRLLFSSAESSQGAAGNQQHTPKSMLEASQYGEAGQALGGALGGAAAARIQAAGAAAGPSMARRVLGWLFDASIIAALGATAAGGYYYCRYSLSEVEAMLHEAQSEPSPSLPSQVWMKAVEAYLSLAVPADRKIREYTDPTCDVLLPELAPELRGRVKTLVVDLEGVLVHKEWTRAKGWQVLKRPGVEAFLLEMGRRYEVVIYTDEPGMYADPVINKIDPHRAIQYRLYRQETQYKDGKHVRDLSKLNRDLSQVLFISANPDAYAFQPENALKLRPWDHSANDTTLLDLIPFLQMVQEVHVQDVRDVVKSYDGEEDVAAAFKQRMAQLAQHKKQGSRFKLQ